MSSMLQFRLENERAIFESLLFEERKDDIARIVLLKSKQEIDTLERLIDAKTIGQKVIEHRHSSRIIRYVCEAMHRFWNNQEGWNYSIFRVPEEAVLQAQGASK